MSESRPLIYALILSLCLHLGFFLHSDGEKNNAHALNFSNQQPLALKLMPKKIEKPMPKAEEILTTAANDASTRIQPKKEEQPEPVAVKKEVIEQLEEVVTRKAQFSSQPIPPVYPETARRKRQEGLVMVRAQVDDLGKTRAVKIAQTSGFPLLDKAALAAVAQWAFIPATHNGKTITAWIEVPIDFKLR